MGMTRFQQLKRVLDKIRTAQQAIQMVAVAPGPPRLESETIELARGNLGFAVYLLDELENSAEFNQE